MSAVVIYLLFLLAVIESAMLCSVNNGNDADAQPKPVPKRNGKESLPSVHDRPRRAAASKMHDSVPRQHMHQNVKRADDTGEWEPIVQQLSQRVTEMSARITALENDRTDLLAQINTLAHAGGSVYVRWGHTACPGSAETVYSGTMGGPLWSDKGSGSNLLCMPPNPVFDNYKRTDCGPSTIYGSEYEVCPDPHHNMDIVCVVCRAPRINILLMPATNVCPSGWTVEYTGHMMGGYGGYSASTDYVCVDANPQDRPGGQADNDGQRLYYTVAKCGSLPCPPYQEGKILSCAVCSK